ncbi:MAG: class I SAM-dependent methyltransferase [Alphaproteobacteria bacterium]|nr:class I SAM-dependent methyltransferase [Alphaproteobacteria bacterium]
MSNLSVESKLTNEQYKDILLGLGWNRTSIEDLEPLGWTPASLLKAYASGYKTPEEIREIDLWSQRYIQEDHLWGDERSETASVLIRTLNEPSQRVLEIGFGYGRDLTALLNQGHTVIGIEESLVGFNEAVKRLKTAMAKEKASLTYGSFRAAPLTGEFFDAVMAHRVLHLIHPDNIEGIINRIAHILKPSGLAVISARDPDDFNPDQMEMINENTAVYKDPKRKRHTINFWTPERYKLNFGENFNLLAFYKGQEMESSANVGQDKKIVQTSFTVAVMKKRNNGHDNSINSHLPTTYNLPSITKKSDGIEPIVI